MRDGEYGGGIDGHCLVVRGSAAFSGNHILSGVRAEVLDETVMAPGASSLACLPSESDQEHVDVFPSVWGRDLFEGSPYIVVCGFLGYDSQALRYSEDVSVHWDDPAARDEHEDDVRCLGADAGEAHEGLPRLGEGFLHHVVEGPIETCHDLLRDLLEHSAPLVVHPGWPNGFGNGLEGSVGEILGGYSDHLLQAVVGRRPVPAVGVLAQDRSHKGSERVIR